MNKSSPSYLTYLLCLVFGNLTISPAGIATFKLAETFKTTIGLDPSEGMISAARSLITERAPNGSVVKFHVSRAEDISTELISDGSVDLITAATCAHVRPPPQRQKPQTSVVQQPISPRSSSFTNIQLVVQFRPLLPHCRAHPRPRRHHRALHFTLQRAPHNAQRSRHQYSLGRYQDCRARPVLRAWKSASARLVRQAAAAMDDHVSRTRLFPAHVPAQDVWHGHEGGRRAG